MLFRVSCRSPIPSSEEMAAAVIKGARVMLLMVSLVLGVVVAATPSSGRILCLDLADAATLAPAES